MWGILYCWVGASNDWLMVSLLWGKVHEDMVERESKHGYELEGGLLVNHMDVLLQATPAVLAGVSSKITWLGEAALALPAAGGLAGSTEEGFGWTVWAHSGTIHMCWKFLVLFVVTGGRGGRGEEGEINEISQAWIQFRLPLKWLLKSQWNKVYLYECSMGKKIWSLSTEVR